MCEKLNIAKTRTTAYHPSSNGTVEIYNKSIAYMIRCAISDQREWDVYLPFCTSAIRSMINQTTGFSPNMMMLGREVKRPVDLLLGQNDSENLIEPEYVKKLIERMQTAHEAARNSIKTKIMYKKKMYDQNSKLRSYSVGDFVYRLREGTKKGVSKKLLPLWVGPFIITQVISPILFKIENRKKTLVVHHDKIKLCQDRHIPWWLRRRRAEIMSLDETIGYDIDELDGELNNLGIDPENVITPPSQPVNPQLVDPQPTPLTHTKDAHSDITGKGEKGNSDKIGANKVGKKHVYAKIKQKPKK